MSDKIRLIHDGEKNELRAALENIRRGKREMIEFQSVLAEIRFAAYQAHIQAGFTEEQALELCTDLTM